MDIGEVLAIRVMAATPIKDENGKPSVIFDTVFHGCDDGELADFFDQLAEAIREMRTYGFFAQCRAQEELICNRDNLCSLEEFAAALMPDVNAKRED